MNNWFRSQNNRSSRLRQSLVDSSAASIRTPLPVIIQSERNDEIFSNKSKGSREINSESDHQGQQQNMNKFYQYDFDSRNGHHQDIGYRSMMRQSMNLYHNNNTGYQNKKSIANLYHQSRIPQNNYSNNVYGQMHRPKNEDESRDEKGKKQQMNRRKKIKQSTNIWDNSGYHKPKIGNNLRQIYSSESSSSNNHRQYKKSKQGRRFANSKQLFKQQYMNVTGDPINRQVNMPYITSLNPNTNKNSQIRTPEMTKIPLSMDSSINNSRSNSGSGSASNSDTIFMKKITNADVNKKGSQQKYQNNYQYLYDKDSLQKQYQQRQPKQEYYSKQEPIQFEESNSQQLIQQQFKQFSSIRPNYEEESVQVRKIQQQPKVNKYKNVNERKNIMNQNTDRNNFIRKTTPANKNELANSKKWINSLNSLTSMHMNSLSNSNRGSIINQDSSLVQSIVTQYDPMKKTTGTSLFKNNSMNYSRHSHTNSKRLLTTNRNTKDRRQYIVCIIEYCSNEVGIACYNIKTGQISLTQIIQRMTYLKTVSTLERFYPQQIVFSSTLENTLLMRKLMANFKRTTFRPIKRMLFDETKGYYIYTQRGNKNQNNPDHKFLAYAALNALLVTMESTFSFTVTYSALNIKWHFLEEVLVIDSQTVADLEIFINKQTKVIKNTFIDNFKCLTDGGMRMLRANILQPLTDILSINERIQLVQLLLNAQNKSILDLLMKELVKFKNYETITAKFIQTPKCENIRSIKSYLYAILMLSRMCYELRNLEKKVGSIIQNITLSNRNKDVNSILKNLHSKLADQRLDQIRKIIQQNFDEQILKNYQNIANNEINTTAANNKKHKNKQVRNTSNNASMNMNRNGNKKDSFIFVFKLDKIDDQFAEISRLTYSHTIEDILKTFEKIKQKAKNEHNVKLLYNQHRGYFLSGKHSTSNQFDLSYLSNTIQDDIIHINTKNNTVTFTTSILISLNNRLKQNQSKLIYQSTELLLATIKDIQKNMDALFQVSYWISMLDMLIGFVGFIKSYQSQFKVEFCRPQFFCSTQGESPVLKIEKLRTIWTMQKFNKLSSDICIELAPQTHSLVIHKQLNSFDQLNILYSIGFMTILSQIGCLVPAESFSTSIYEILISKMEIEGNLQNKMSHFQMQLVSLRNILDNVGEKDQLKKQCKKSKRGKFLVLMDEICKGTKASQQYALSLAAVQELLFKTQEQNNVSIILVSDRVLFNMLGNFQKLSLCEFCVMEQNNQDFDQKLTNQQRIIVQKQRQLVQCFRNYNFSNNFLELYEKLPKVLTE